MDILHCVEEQERLAVGEPVLEGVGTRRRAKIEPPDTRLHVMNSI